MSEPGNVWVRAWAMTDSWDGGRPSGLTTHWSPCSPRAEGSGREQSAVDEVTALQAGRDPVLKPSEPVH